MAAQCGVPAAPISTAAASRPRSMRPPPQRGAAAWLRACSAGRCAGSATCACAAGLSSSASLPRQATQARGQGGQHHRGRPRHDQPHHRLAPAGRRRRSREVALHRHLPQRGTTKVDVSRTTAVGAPPSHALDAEAQRMRARPQRLRRLGRNAHAHGQPARLRRPDREVGARRERRAVEALHVDPVAAAGPRSRSSAAAGRRSRSRPSSTQRASAPRSRTTSTLNGLRSHSEAGDPRGAQRQQHGAVDQHARAQHAPQQSARGAQPCAASAFCVA